MPRRVMVLAVGVVALGAVLASRAFMTSFVRPC